MKHPIRNVLATLLTIAMLTALFPAPATHAAAADDLRSVVANQATALAAIEWKLWKRNYGYNYEKAKISSMHNAGLFPASYYEYKRMYIPYIGAILDENSASYEQILNQLDDDGYLPTKPDFSYYGMNPDAFLVDVVSRVSPTKITGVKQAITSGALTSLLSGVNASAQNSQDAAKAVASWLQSWKTKLRSAYGNLHAGDLLIAWDDSAPYLNQIENTSPAPKLHVMVVTDVNVSGSISVTFPAYNHPTYYFTCDTCGVSSSETTYTVAPKHVESTPNYDFLRYKSHSEVDTSSTCSGTFQPDGGTVWRTRTITASELLDKVPEGGTCYIPYTLPVYTNGAPAVNVTLDTSTTQANLLAGFSGTITSNYRITQVDAVLTTDGAPDQTFTHYPAYDAWSYEFVDNTLNQALASITGSCTLTLNVHSGPIANPATMADPVTQVFSVSTLLGEPSFEMTSDVDLVHQGQSVRVGIAAVENDITYARMNVSYDRDTYAFDLAKTQRSNGNAVTFSQSADGSVYVEYNGPALTGNAILANLYFTPYRTGSMPISADQTDPFAAYSVWKATAEDPDPVATRFGSDPVALGIGYNLKVYSNYAAGKSLLLLATEGTPVNATYNGQKMLEVTNAHYDLDGEIFTHQYAIVVDRADLDLGLVSATPVSSTSAIVLPYLLDYDYDVNRSGGVDIRDAQAAANIISGRMPLEGNLEKWLVADTDASGKIDSADIVAILAATNR